MSLLEFVTLATVGATIFLIAHILIHIATGA
jgi:hypothetical protein